VLYTTAGGVLLPAIIVAINPAREALQVENEEDIPAKPESVNLQVFTDESLPNILHIGDVGQSAEPEAGKFHFAADAEKPAKKAKAEKGAE